VGKYLWIVKTLVILGLCAVIFIPAAYFSYELFIRPNQIPPEEAQAAATPPPDPSLPELEKALDIKGKRNLLEARTALEEFLENYPYSTRLGDAEKALGQVNTDIFFSAIPAPEKTRYEVKKGDALEKIERKLKTTRELLMRCNNLEDPRRLSVGQVLFVNEADFSLLIDRKSQTVTIFNHTRFFKKYTPLEWHTPAPRKGAAQVPISAKVRDKVAWYNGVRVLFGSREYASSTRWVDFTVKGFTFYSEEGPKPTGGIVFSAGDMEELSTLLGKNVPVSIQ